MENKLVKFPLRDDKKPAVPRGTDWRKYDGDVESPIIGVMIPDGVYIIDVDTYKGVSIDDIKLAMGAAGVGVDWTGAELQKTMSGGTHYAFRVPVGVELINGANVIVDGLDTRASGKGYIATGRGYDDLSFMGVLDTLSNPEVLPELGGDALELFKVRPEKTVSIVGDGVDDLMLDVANQPLDISDTEVLHYMSMLTEEHAADSSVWLDVMFALYHQTKGSADGWKLFDEFSRKAMGKYNERENKSRWDSCGRNPRENPITFRRIISLAGGRVKPTLVKGGLFDEIMAQAKAVDSFVKYDRFKARIAKVTLSEIGVDLRAMLANEIHSAYGKGAGITRSDIKKAIMPAKRRIIDSGGDNVGGDNVEWLDGWIYVEKNCEFVNVDTLHNIKREAFNARYDREAECVNAETNAANFALTIARIPTVADSMFWPGADKLFDYEELQMLNDYKTRGVTPVDVIDERAQLAIDRFLNHVRFTISDEREQTILLDWMAYTYQNPGKRVNWALLLQGAPGTGKSYFVDVMTHLMGTNVRNLDPAAISERFTGWAHGSLVIAVEEIRISGANRYEVMDRLKPFITNTTVQIEEKGRDHRTVPNFTSYFMLTNHKDAIPVDGDDRRYCVIFGNVQSKSELYDLLGGESESERYFAELFGSLNDDADAIARYFTDYKISESFNPRGRAPETKAKREMTMLAESIDDIIIAEALDSYHAPHINDVVLDITALNDLCTMDGLDLPAPRTIGHKLTNAGYIPITGRRKKIEGRHHYIWYKPKLIEEQLAINKVLSQYAPF